MVARRSSRTTQAHNPGIGPEEGAGELRILHTSDWHYGRSLKGIDLTEHHRAAAHQMAEIARERAVDLIIVAGDVYDRSIPHNDAVKLLDATLEMLCPIAPVVLTPGNHDSATRLGFAASRLDDRLHIGADLADAHEPIMFTDEHGDVAVYALPFLDNEEVRQLARDVSGEDVPRAQSAATAWMMGRVREDLAARGGPRAVVVAHAFVVDGAGKDAAEESESERDITAGGVDHVPTGAFDGVSYVALGHLHGAQTRRPTTSGTVLEYSGSPLRFSISERNQRKSVTIVDLDAGGRVEVARVPIEQPRGMAQLTGEFTELLAAGDGDGPHKGHVDDWVDIIVTDARRPEEMRQRLVRVFPHLLSCRHQPDDPRHDPDGDKTKARPEPSSPIEVMCEFFEEMTGVAVTPEEHEVLMRAVTEAFEGVR